MRARAGSEPAGAAAGRSTRRLRRRGAVRGRCTALRARTNGKNREDGDLTPQGKIVRAWRPGSAVTAHGTRPRRAGSSVTRTTLAGPLALGRNRLGRQRERALLVGVHHADSDQLARDFLPAVVADGDDDRVFPRVAVGGMANAALDAQRRDRRRRRGVAVRVEAQVVPARRAPTCAFEDRFATVRTCAGRPWGTGAHAADRHACYAPWPLPCLVPPRPPLPSSQPNSAWPRRRAPAATVREPALTSPWTTPLCCSSTSDASSTLPSSSPAIVTRSARTAPVSLAPVSIVRSPWTLTSPLNLPAMRTLPPPSIFPSIVMSAAISDSLRAGAAVARIAGAGVAARGAGAGASSGFGGGGGS